MSGRPLPSSFDGDSDFYEENRWEKLIRLIKEEPLIPLGCGLTVAALVGASRSIRAGDRERTNRMFRARVYAQGFTVLAMVAGSVYWKSDRQKRKEFDQVLADRKAEEKRDAWIKELEARDEEAKEIRAMRAGRMPVDKPSQTMEKAAEKVKGSAKKSDDKWKEDPAEVQLGVVSSASETEENNGIMGRIKWIWSGK